MLSRYLSLRLVHFGVTFGDAVAQYVTHNIVLYVGGAARRLAHVWLRAVPPMLSESV